MCPPSAWAAGLSVALSETLPQLACWLVRCFQSMKTKWRKRVGVEPTGDGVTRRPPVLKTGTITGPHALPRKFAVNSRSDKEGGCPSLAASFAKAGIALLPKLNRNVRQRCYFGWAVVRR